jgi:hypothetical protein
MPMAQTRMYNSKETLGKVLFWSGLAVAIALLLLPSKTPALTVVLLIALFASLIYPVLQLEYVQKRSLRTSVCSLLLLGGLTIAFGWVVWPERPYLKLSDQQRAEFINALRQIPNPEKKIRVGCDASEEVCAAATDFLELCRINYLQEDFKTPFRLFPACARSRAAAAGITPRAASGSEVRWRCLNG